jgi:hypothetical protein
MNRGLKALMRTRGRHMHGHAVMPLWTTANANFIERYFELLKDAKVKGYLFAQYNYLDGPYKDIKKP